MSTTTTAASKVRQDLATMHRRYAAEFNAFFGGMDDEQREEYDAKEWTFAEDLVALFEAEGHDMAAIGRHFLAEFLESQMNRWGVVHTAHATRDN